MDIDPLRRTVLAAFQIPSWYNLVVLVVRRGPVLAAFQIPSWYNSASMIPITRMVLAAFQIPSWYNKKGSMEQSVHVLAAFQIPSWYNKVVEVENVIIVLAAFQIPSWYNGRKKKAPVTWCFLLFPLFKITEKRYQSGSINDPACFFEKGCPLAKRGHYLAGTSEEAPCLGSGPSNSPVGIMKLPSNLHCSIYGVLMK